MFAYLLAAAAQAAQPATPSAIEGRWISPSRDVIIAIAPCGDAQCGTVTWATEQAQADARRGVESLVGSQLLTDLKPSSDGEWKGRLFIPDRKLRVTAKLAPQGADALKVSGCEIGICKSQIWFRSEGSLPSEQ